MHTPPIKYPIGIQTFSEIREEGYVYVDKTALIYQLVNDFKFVFLSRPRRFGKSLLVSTIGEYFGGNRKLFEGLAIDKLETQWRSYPILRFDLSSADYNHPDILCNKLTAYLDRMGKIYGAAYAPEIGDRFYNVIAGAYEQTGKRVVILIDEYDKPILDTLHDAELLESMQSRLRSFYSVLKECDSMIRFAMLTGVTKFGKVSVFSGLNNLKDISMLPAYNDICGITEKELHDNFTPSMSIFAPNNGMTIEECWKKFKDFYDGYRFARGGSDIYNPFSTLNAFCDRHFGLYWYETGSSSYLIRLIRRNHFALKDMEGITRTESALNNIMSPTNDIVPLLYQAGYLTIKDYSPTSRMYTLGFPNTEVKEGFWNSLADYFFRTGRNITEFDIEKFVSALERGDADDFMRRMRSLFASISSEHEPDKEVHFQNMIAILVRLLGFIVRAEVHSSQGRSDIEIITPQYIYIIELKIDSSAETALAQIENRGYARQYEVDPRPKILIGANFSTSTRTLSDWDIRHA